jgi:hypothetical protein
MDITQQELKTMKAKQLRRLIREAITEVLAEAPDPIVYSTDSLSKTVAKDRLKKTPKFTSLKQPDKDALFKGIDQDKDGGVINLEEDGLDEAKGYKLTNPEMNINITNPRTGEPARIGGILFSDILAAIRDTEGISDRQLFDRFKFNPETGIGLKKVQQLNGMLKGLTDAGVINRLGRGGEVEVAPEPGEEQPEDVTGPEALFIGSGNPLSQYFDDEPNDDGSEDFNAEEEPTIAAAGTAPTSTASMSDEDYEAFMEYTKLADRLAATKSNILKMKRSRGGSAAGDIRDTTGGTELARLQDLKKSLQDKIDALVAGSNYLKKRTGQSTIEEPIETPEEEDETIDEAFDREYELRKLQFYAGIIK